ncbi:ABC transporter permease, partial [Sinorhizobium meliloti]
MLRFILSRLMMAIPTIVLVAVAVFALIRFIPGDPAALMLGDMAQPDQIAAMRVELGLDRSMPQQFLIWAGDV